MQETEKFILAVQNHPCLWNPNLPTFKCRDTRYAAWRDIIRIARLPDVDAAKEKWKKLKDALRETFNKRRKEAKLGNSKRWSRPYKFEHVMQFLVPILEEQVSQRFYEEPLANDDDTTETRSILDQKLNCQEVDAQDILNQTQMSRGFKRPHSDAFDLIDSVHNDSQRQYLTQLPEFDAMDRFFLSMAESAKKLPDSLQLQVKRKVFNAVIDAEDLYINNVFGVVNETSSIPDTDIKRENGDLGDVSDANSEKLRHE